MLIDRKGMYVRLLMSITGVFIFMVLTGCGLFVKNIPPGQIVSGSTQDHFIEIGDINYHYQEFVGPGDNIFLLHGFSSSTYTWEKVAARLNAQGYHVWAMDMKGFGWSDKPKGASYDPVSLMEDVNAWMDAMDLNNVVFVGNSLGGAIAVLMAAEHPEKIDGLVLIDASGYPRKRPLLFRIGKLPLAGNLVKLVFGPWMVKKNLREVFFHKDWVTKEQIDAYYDRLRTQGALDVQISLIKSIEISSFEDYVRSVFESDIKTLIIWGKDDEWIPLEFGYRFKKDLPNSTLAVIPECGHTPQEEKPDVTATLIKDFVEGKPIQEFYLPEFKDDVQQD